MSEGPAPGSRQSSQAAGVAAVVTAAVAFAATLAVWVRGGGGFDVAWLPSWGARLAFRFDGLGALYGLLATGIGVAVFTYEPETGLVSAAKLTPTPWMTALSSAP